MREGRLDSFLSCLSGSYLFFANMCPFRSNWLLVAQHSGSGVTSHIRHAGPNVRNHLQSLGAKPTSETQGPYKIQTCETRFPFKVKTRVPSTSTRGTPIRARTFPLSLDAVKSKGVESPVLWLPFCEALGGRKWFWPPNVQGAGSPQRLGTTFKVQVRSPQAKRRTPAHSRKAKLDAPSK